MASSAHSQACCGRLVAPAGQLLAHSCMQSRTSAHPATGALRHQRIQLQPLIGEVCAGVVAPDGHNSGIIGTGSLQG